jgi:hypothetical protein
VNKLERCLMIRDDLRHCHIRPLYAQNEPPR